MDGAQDLTARLKDLAQRQWDVRGIERRLKTMQASGLPKKMQQPGAPADIASFLDRVQRHAEEYNYLLENCAQATALALLEAFELGNMTVVKALTHFPGIGGTGEMCGAVTGSLVALGLYFGPDDLLACDVKGASMAYAQQFIAAFKGKMGYLRCSDIQKHVIFGKDMDPGAGEENMKAFAEAKGFEKCGLAPGVGARLAAEMILKG